MWRKARGFFVLSVPFTLPHTILYYLSPVDIFNKISNLRDFSEFRVRGYGTLAGGYLFLTMFPRGIYVQRCRGGGISIFYKHEKQKKRIWQNAPFAQFPAALNAPFVRFTPAALKSFRHPGGGIHFWQRIWGRELKSYEGSKGGVSIFYGHFSQKLPPPPTRNSEQSLRSKKKSFMDFIVNIIELYVPADTQPDT